jgi:hypothetical protein
MGFVIGSFLLLLTVSYLLARPLVLPASAGDGDDPARARDDLIRRIADLDFDLATGKLGDEDHARLRAEAMARAVAVIGAPARTDEDAADEDTTTELPGDLRTAFDDGAFEDDIERLVAARRRAVDRSAR